MSELKSENGHIEFSTDDTRRAVLAPTIEDVTGVTEQEHQMTLWQGMKSYSRAVFWSATVSMTIVMDGYDTSLLGSLFAVPSFKEKFGDYNDGVWGLPASWQTALSMMVSIGSLFGILIGFHFTERFGYRRIMFVGLVAATGFIFMLVLAPNRTVLLVGELLMGLPNGLFGVMGPTYASEVCPVVLRGYLTSYVYMCFIFGQVLAQGVLKASQARTDDWAWRIPFAIQWVWPIPLSILLYFAPESPWWYVRRGKIDEAEKSLKRLTSTTIKVDIPATVAMMVHTTEMEKQFQEGTSYWDCFKGIDLRRTEISCMSLVIQSVSLGKILAFAIYFFELAGVPTSAAFSLGIGQYAIGFVAVWTAWFLMPHVGRRAIYMYGLVIMIILYLVMGFVSLAPTTNIATPWVTASLLYVIVFVYDASIGAIGWCLIGEVSSSRLRGRTIGLSRNSFHLCAIINSVIYPYILNANAGNWKGKVGFFLAGLSFLCLVWTYFRLPETQGRTYEELDIMFIKKVSARQFSKYQIETLDINHIVDNETRGVEVKDKKDSL
ncbi:maltose permease MAL61 [Lipomyces kononenkoae]|uniref:Maltose permease MAL61 n=1 Tax=Lipomyces kononenkoae TaxID=34357 RepID=A0ACC3SYM8_LIPKO